MSAMTCYHIGRVKLWNSGSLLTEPGGVESPVRGQRGPVVYLLEQRKIEEYVPDLRSEGTVCVNVSGLLVENRSPGI